MGAVFRRAPCGRRVGPPSRSAADGSGPAGGAAAPRTRRQASPGARRRRTAHPAIPALAAAALAAAALAVALAMAVATPLPAVAAPLPAAPEVAAPPPARVLSLNLCADDYLLTLAPERAVAVTRLARDPALSVVAAAARRVATVIADPEAVLARRPDLVLAARFGAQATLAALRARGLRIELVAAADGFAAIRAETRRVGALLGVPARAEAALAVMDRALQGVQQWPGTRALYLEPRGWSSGAGTLADAVLRAAGLRDVGDGADWPLERIAAHPPDLLVLPTAPGAPSLATAFLRHPVLAGIPTRSVPAADLICAGPWTAAAVRALSR